MLAARAMRNSASTSIHRQCEFDVALYSGMREGEQYDLVWPDVTFEIKECTARDSKEQNLQTGSPHR